MRRLLCLCGVLVAPLLVAGSASGQAGTISIYADTEGTIPYLYDTEPGTITCYVVHTGAVGVAGCQFAAPLPDCFEGTYMGDQTIFPVTIGNSQSGVSIGYGSCLSTPVHVLTFKVFNMGLTGPACEWPVLPAPISETHEVEVVDCDFNLLAGRGGKAIVNPGDRHCEQPVLSLNGYETVSWDGRVWEVKVQMVNSGLGAARDVSVTMQDDLPWMIVQDARCYYGTVPAGDSTWGGGDTYVFDLMLHPGGSFNAWFDVSYRDTCDMSHTLRLDPEFDPEAEVAMATSPGAGALEDGALGQNYPNPFNPITTIPLNLRESADVRLAIFDSRGALVRVLADGRTPPGVSEFVWDGRDANGNVVSSGMYFCRLTRGTSIETRKIVLLK